MQFFGCKTGIQIFIKKTFITNFTIYNKAIIVLSVISIIFFFILKSAKNNLAHWANTFETKTSDAVQMEDYSVNAFL